MLGHALDVGEHPVTQALSHIGTGGLSLAAKSPRLMGSLMHGLGAVERRMTPHAAGLPSTLRRGVGYAQVPATRKDVREKAQQALQDKEFKRTLAAGDLRTLRKVATDPNASSQDMLTARDYILRNWPMRITLEPAEPKPYGGGSGDVPSRQEGGPVQAGRVYKVGETPDDQPRPETYVPDQPSEQRGIIELLWDKLVTSDPKTDWDDIIKHVESYISKEMLEEKGISGATKLATRIGGLKGGGAASIAQTGTGLLQYDVGRGYPLRSRLRKKLGIEDPHEVAPWLPGGSWHPETILE
jgi:hypothetical protein